MGLSGVCREAMIGLATQAYSRLALQTAIQRKAGLRVRCSATRRSPREFKSQEEILGYAQSAFRSVVGHDKADGDVHLALACMLIALEEEAAYEMELKRLHQQGGGQLAFLQTLAADAEASGLDWDDEMSVEFTNRDLGTRPTWDLSRLDAMAAEARALCDTIWSVDGGPGPSKGTTQAGPVGGPPASAPTPLVPRTQTDGVPRRRPQLRSRMVSANWAPSWGGTAGRDSAGASAGGNASRDRNSSSTGNAGAVPVNPVQALVAVNSVLFDRHGYRRMDRHGDPRDAMLPQVLERGTGTPAALAILYMEVCQRLGVPMAAQLLEEGRYMVLWPLHQPLVVAGCRFVIDAYTGGDSICLDEVCELFELESRTLQPAAKRELLSALLACLQHAHWARAVNCPPEPALAVPLSLATAASGTLGGPIRNFDMERAIAAAERRCFLTPHLSEPLLELTLLYYFSGQYSEAAESLALYLEMDNTAQADSNLDTLRAKLCLILGNAADLSRLST